MKEYSIQSTPFQVSIAKRSSRNKNFFTRWTVSTGQSGLKKTHVFFLKMRCRPASQSLPLKVVLVLSNKGTIYFHHLLEIESKLTSALHLQKIAWTTGFLSGCVIHSPQFPTVQRRFYSWHNKQNILTLFQQVYIDILIYCHGGWCTSHTPRNIFKKTFH